MGKPLPGGRHEVILHSPDHDASFPALGAAELLRSGDQVRRAVTRRFTQNHWPVPHFLDAVPSDGARRICSALG